MMDDWIPFEEAKQIAFDFKGLLQKHNISITPGSDIERIYLRIIELLDYKTITVNFDTRPIYQELMGLHDFAIKLLRVQDHPDFPKLLPHINLLNNASILQNKLSVVTDEGSNKLFELYIATIFMQLGSELDLESPQAKKSQNPDILVKMDGAKWGIACKVLHSNKYMTFVNRLSDGINQIEKSNADIGFVVFNFKNIIPHEDIWPIINKAAFENGDEPIFDAYTDIKFPSSELQKIGNQFYDDLNKSNGLEEIRKLFINQKSLPIAIGYISTAVGILHNQRPFPSRLSTFHIIKFDKLNDKYKSLFERMNKTMQNRQTT